METHEATREDGGGTKGDLAAEGPEERKKLNLLVMNPSVG
jgi:hypothetical protein